MTNKHGRSVRVISKAPSNATVNQTVKPGASVSIKVKFQTGNMEQVELTAVDENTGIRVALNQNKSIVVNTTFNQNVVTKVTASPLGKFFCLFGLFVCLFVKNSKISCLLYIVTFPSHKLNVWIKLRNKTGSLIVVVGWFCFKVLTYFQNTRLTLCKITLIMFMDIQSWRK